MDKKELIEEIKEEIKNLERLEGELKSVLDDISAMEREPTFKEIRISGSILHDFYSGIEKIFERISLAVDNNFPQGEKWHIILLSQMAKSYGDIRPAVISENLYEKLKEYLKFRHLFRHIYGFELKWERIKPLVLSMPDVFHNLKKDIRKFMDYLEADKQLEK